MVIDGCGDCVWIGWYESVEMLLVKSGEERVGEGREEDIKGEI